LKKRLQEVEDATKRVEDEEKKKTEKKATLLTLQGSTQERSVIVKHANGTIKELEQWFRCCGLIRQLTMDHAGAARIEFQDKDAVANALVLSGSEFKGRPLTVCLFVCLFVFSRLSFFFALA
jgi:hypothetical protein